MLFLSIPQLSAAGDAINSPTSLVTVKSFRVVRT